MKTLVLALSVLGLAVAPAWAQTESTTPIEFATVDADGDGQATMDELKAAGVNLSEEQVTAADADGNGSLSEEEYKTATAG